MVVGAGPTGLWTAAEVALTGVPVVVLEKRTVRSPHARALGLMPRTLDVLAARGAAAPFLAAGHPVPAWHFGLLREGIRFDVLDTDHPFMLLLPQTTTEALLEERARGLGVEIVTGAAVTGVEQHDTGVTVTSFRDGVEHRTEAAFVVGADGAHSVVRTLAGIAFEGEPSRSWGFVGDVRLQDPPPPGTRVVRPDGALVVAPLPDGRHRLTGWDPGHQDPDEQLDTATLRTFAERMTGTDLGVHDPSWLSRFGDENRLAATYRQGRVLLAGDAAHVHWPTGGLGLNAGVQDAAALGWRLAAVARGAAAGDLLDDYATERRAYGASLRTSTLTQGALITATTPDALAIRATLDRLLAVPDGNRAIAAWVAGLSPETTLPRLLDDGTGRGDRSGRWSASGRPVLLVSGDGRRSPAVEALAADERLVVVRVAFADDGVSAALVRPDGHVAWVGGDREPDPVVLAEARRSAGLA